MNSRAFRPLLALALPFIAAACATVEVGPEPLPPPPPPNQVFIATPYDPAAFAWSLVKGGNGIDGHSPPGYSCAGLAVGLTPDAPYSRERIVKLYGSAVRADRTVAEIRGVTVGNDNPDLHRFVRATRCDAGGRFTFTGLPDGGYFLIAQVASPNGPMALMRHVVLRGGDVEPVQLTIRP